MSNTLENLENTEIDIEKLPLEQAIQEYIRQHHGISLEELSVKPSVICQAINVWSLKHICLLDESLIDIDDIHEMILEKHIKNLKRLMIRNDIGSQWNLDRRTARLIAESGAELLELVVAVDSAIFKAEAAAQKQAVLDSKKAADDERKWQQGAKSNAKKESEESKRTELARKKAERDALLAAEESSQPSKPKGAGAKSAAKKTRGTLDLSHLDEALAGNTSGSKKVTALNASGIDNALDALSLTAHSDQTKIDRHPERRFKAAYAAFEARRLPEIESEQPGLRRQQRIELVRKEFEKSEENPFNKVNVAYDASRDEVAKIKETERAKIENRLADR
ncbi:hypothetical protein LOZ58_001164 [Ophidiomyces ophidiicola]|nr:hypothetical protein LOZ58_001164 [Ophidiomyces ophidiicola]